MTVNEEQDRIISEFSELADWLVKYEYLLELGRKLPSVNQKIKTDEYALKGCSSQVWILAELHNGRLCITADSESVIIRGIISLILRVFNNQLPEEVATAEVYFLQQIGLSTGLSPVRANGVNAIIEYIKSRGRFFQNV